MNYTPFGRTGMKVSQLILGTTNFGLITDEVTSHRLLDLAFEHGINCLDTADTYGYHQGRGLTETIIGRWLHANPHKRDRLIVATKIYSEMSDDPNDQGVSAYHLRRGVEASLRRLQTDHIDLYQMHHIDRPTSWEEVWQGMERLILAGKISYVGSSNFAGWHIAQANERALQRHLLGLVSEQSVYNLAERMVELEVLPACANYGMAFIPYSPVCGGVLAGSLQTEQTVGRRVQTGRQKMVEKYRPKLEHYEPLCAKWGVPPAEVALAWILHQPHVTAPIIGPRTPEQLQSSLRALELRLSAEQLQQLDTIWSPYGPAPEYYAW